MGREDLAILAVGDNVVDKYLSRGKMYPGGQCVNTCVYAQENGVRAAYLGVCGEGVEARLIEDTLKAKGIDHSRCRYAPGEGGFALVTLQDGDRVFLGSNKGGVARTHLLRLTQEDLEYAKGFSLVYSNCNGFADRELPKLKAAGLPIAFDFSDRWTPEYLQATLPWVDIALLSCSHLPAGQREQALDQALRLGAKIAVATAGQEGSWARWEGKLFHAPAAQAARVADNHGRRGRLLCRLSLLPAADRRERGTVRPGPFPAHPPGHGAGRGLRRQDLRPGGGLRRRRPPGRAHGTDPAGKGLVPMISCVLFDFDCVIADTERSNGDYLAQALAAFGIPFTEEDRLSLIGTNGAGTLDRFLQRSDPPVTREQLAQVRERLGNTYEDSPLSPQPGLREWLEELDRQGVRTGVVSSTSTKYIVTALNRMGLTGQFQVIVCGDMVRRPKPAPHSYQLAMSLLGLSPEDCLAIEDSPTGIRAAQAAGLQVVGYKGGSVEQETGSASWEVRSFQEIKALPPFLG